MILLETISVRLFEPQKAHLVRLLFSEVEQGAAGWDAPEKAFLFQSCDIPGDWNVQLVWNDDNLPKAKTSLGRHLTEYFRNLGFVHHTVWQTY